MDTNCYTPYHSNIHNPTSTEESFLQALQGGRLVLVIILAPWCERGVTDMIQAADQAADWLEQIFQFSSSYCCLQGDREQSTECNPSEEHTYHFPGYHHSLQPLFGYGANATWSPGDSPSSSSSAQHYPAPPRPLPKSIIGILNPTSIPEGLIESLGPISSYPALKFVLTFPPMTDIDGGNNDGGDGEIIVWDYIGPRETAKDLFESVLMYWYRFVVSNSIRKYLPLHANPVEYSTANGNDEINDEKIGHYDTGEGEPPVFTFASDRDMINFLTGHGDRLLRPAQGRRHQHGKKSLESDLYELYMGRVYDNDFSGVFQEYSILDDDELFQNEQTGAGDGISNGLIELTDEIDPYIIFVQCRFESDRGEDRLKHDTENKPEKSIHTEYVLKTKIEFDELAEEMSHRRDVAFFALETSANRLWTRQQKRVIYNVTTDWSSIELSNHIPPALFVPSNAKYKKETNEKIIDAKYIKEQALHANEYIQSSLVPFSVIHATPTVLWFDRDRVAQLAFPSYRPVHAVLFVDLALSHQVIQSSSSHLYHGRPPWPSYLDRSLETSQILLDQKRAISLFYKAALRHRSERPSDDIVFLIVPSSEIGILTAFGIDIWTPIDEAIFGNANFGTENRDGSGSSDYIHDSDQGDDENAGIGYCSSVDGGKTRRILPALVLTDRSGRFTKNSNRYYMCSDDLFTTTSISPEKGGAISTFLDRYFTNSLGEPFIRSESRHRPQINETSSKKNKNDESGVQVITGNTFESMVMDRNSSHTMLLMQTTTCGHCKRFSIFWNQFARLVKAMNWGSVIHVMKIDVAKNDVPHDKIDAWDLPAVYYFPAGEKDNPIEMAYGHKSKEKNNPQLIYDEGLSWVKSGYDLVEWMVEQGKLDLDLLLELDADANDPQSEADVIDIDQL
ncbi:hypothetical protein ACHAXS_014079 [Conticribra weissflogii]